MTKQLIDQNFKDLFSFENKYSLINPISYKLSNNQINIFIRQSLSFISNNNIISANLENKNDDLIDLKQLINIFYFEEELNNIIGDNQENQILVNYIEYNIFFLINRNIIE